MKPSKKQEAYFSKWQSVEHQTAVRCNTLCYGDSAKLLSNYMPTIRTVWDIFLLGLQKAGGEKPCLGWRNGDRYEFLSYSETYDLICKLAHALRQKANLKSGSFVGLYSSNSPQWVIASLACASSSLVLVPLYDTLGTEACSFIVQETEISLLFADTAEAAKRVVDNVTSKTLKMIVILGRIGEHYTSSVSSALCPGIEVISMTDFLKDLTPEDVSDSFLPQPSDLYMVQYTSGTTGQPKGVMLTHGNFAANQASVQYLLEYGTPANRKPESQPPGSPILHYLPMAHSYGQLFTACGFFFGYSIAIFSGNVQKLAEDAQLLKPVSMPMVPRLMNKVYAKVTSELETKGKVARTIFWLAYRQKKKLLLRGVITKSSLWDKLVFHKIQDKLGGRVVNMLTASAPVSPEVLEFWRIVFGAHIFEAYGQTECTALVTAAVDPKGGNVGHPVCCNFIKLVDVPELGYFAAERRGEVCVKGYNVMKGYYKRPDLTAETIDNDGWLHTGDIGEFADDGSLKIIDRKKHIFKLAQGEYIAPEKIESVYSSCPLVAQVYVDGDSLQWFTVAIVVPEVSEAEKWAEEHHLGNRNFAEICENQDFIKTVYDSMLLHGKLRGLNGIEQIKSLHLHPDLFTIAQGLLTPSLKNRRAQFRITFKQELENMYKKGPMA